MEIIAIAIFIIVFFVGMGFIFYNWAYRDKGWKE